MDVIFLLTEITYYLSQVFVCHFRNDALPYNSYYHLLFAVIIENVNVKNRRSIYHSVIFLEFRLTDCSPYLINIRCYFALVDVKVALFTFDLFSPLSVVRLETKQLPFFFLSSRVLFWDVLYFIRRLTFGNRERERERSGRIQSEKEKKQKERKTRLTETRLRLLPTVFPSSSPPPSFFSVFSLC